MIKTILVQLCVVWLSSTQGAYVPRSQRSAGVPGLPGPAERFNGGFGSPSALTSSLPNFDPVGFNEYNPGGAALPATGYPFGFPATDFDYTGLQLQPLLQAYASPAGDFRFPGFGFNVAGYPFAGPPPVLQHFDTAPQLYPTAGLRFDAVPRALPAGNGLTQSLQPVSVFAGESNTKQPYTQQTNDLSAQSITPIPATAPPKVSNEEQPHQYYNPIGDERQVQVLEQTAGVASNPTFKTSSDAVQPQQLQPIQTGNDFTATATPAPTLSSFPAAEPVPDLVLELRPPPYIAPGANPDPSFSSPTNVPSSKPSYPSFSADPINGPGSVSVATTGPYPAVSTPLPPVNTAFDGTKNSLSDAPAGGPYLRESYSTMPPGLLPDAYPTPSISYSLPSETFRLPTSADVYGSRFAPATEGSKNAPKLPMNPIIVPDHSYPAETSASDTGSSSFPPDGGYYSAIPVPANAFGSSNPISANTYSDSNAIQGSSYNNPKLIAGTIFDDSNSISSNSKRESSNVDPRSGISPPPPHYQPNGTK